jgi:hypothetical protein
MWTGDEPGNAGIRRYFAAGDTDPSTWPFWETGPGRQTMRSTQGAATLQPLSRAGHGSRTHFWDRRPMRGGC